MASRWRNSDNINLSSNISDSLPAENEEELFRTFLGVPSANRPTLNPNSSNSLSSASLALRSARFSLVSRPWTIGRSLPLAPPWNRLWYWREENCWSSLPSERIGRNRLNQPAWQGYSYELPWSVSGTQNPNSGCDGQEDGYSRARRLAESWFKPLDGVTSRICYTFKVGSRQPFQKREIRIIHQLCHAGRRFYSFYAPKIQQLFKVWWTRSLRGIHEINYWPSLAERGDCA